MSMQTIWIIFGVCSIPVIGYIIYAFTSGDEGNKSKKKNPFHVKWLTTKGYEYIDILRGCFISAGAGGGKSQAMLNIYKHCAENRIAVVNHDYKDFELTYMSNYFYAKTDLPIWTISPARPDLSHCINPIEPKYIDKFEDINKIAADFAANLSKVDGSGDNAVFLEGAESCFAAVAWRLKEDYPKYCSIPYVVSIIMQKDFTKVLQFIEKSPYAALLGKPYREEALNEKLMGSVQFALTGALRKVCTPEIFKIFGTSDFDLDINTPGKESMLNLVNHPKYDFIYSPFLSTVARCAFNQMSEQGRQPSLFLCDEASKLKLFDVQGIPALLRSYKIGSVFAFQDKVQGKILYSEDIMTALISNLGSKVLGKANDPSTAEWYQKLFELIMVKQRSVSRSTGGMTSGNSSESISERETSKHKAYEFNKLRPGEFFIFDENGKNKKVQFKQLEYTPTPPKQLHNYSKTELKLNFDNILAKALTLE